MPVLIDCYNLLHAADKPDCFAGLDEAGLCRALARFYGPGERATLVCDGGPKPGVPPGEAAPGVHIVYSGKSRQADDLIADLVDRDSAPRRLTVVSSDHQVQRIARHRGARAVDCSAFLHELAQGLSIQGAGAWQRGAGHVRGAASPMSPEEVARWAKEFGLDPEAPIDPDEPVLPEDEELG